MRDKSVPEAGVWSLQSTRVPRCALQFDKGHTTPDRSDSERTTSDIVYNPPSDGPLLGCKLTNEICAACMIMMNRKIEGGEPIYPLHLVCRPSGE